MNLPQPNVGSLINRISRLSQRWLDARLKEFGIAGAAVPVLAILKANGKCTQRELALHIGTEQPTMAQLLKRMERDGLIVRESDPEDARSAHVYLTEQASRALPAARAAMQNGHELVTSDFSKRDLDTLTRLLERYLKNVEKQIELL